LIFGIEEMLMQVRWVVLGGSIIVLLSQLLLPALIFQTDISTEWIKAIASTVISVLMVISFLAPWFWRSVLWSGLAILGFLSTIDNALDIYNVQAAKISALNEQSIISGPKIGIGLVFVMIGTIIVILAALWDFLDQRTEFARLQLFRKFREDKIS
jgi:hypothetical protein